MECPVPLTPGRQRQEEMAGSPREPLWAPLSGLPSVARGEEVTGSVALVTAFH